ncbi:MAG: polysaccharide deacetylase family protein [Chloroflexi bacterium]|nr:polysaccharide deacetylase family protein [Chloroflexota bacterium]
MLSFVVVAAVIVGLGWTTDIRVNGGGLVASPSGSQIAAAPSAQPTASASVAPSASATVGSGTPSPTAAPSVVPIPLPSASPTPLPPTRRAEVPILYYHRIQELPSDYREWSAAKRRQFMTYNVLPAAFAAQLDWLRDHGYTTILPRDLAAHWDRGAPLPARPVIITFDDGSSDWLKTVRPMLKRRGMVAEFYLTLDAIKHGNVTWDGVRRLAAAGNGIGAHNVHHFQLAGLGPGRKAVSARKQWAELSKARTIIGENIGVYPDSMAYVGGGYDDKLIALVQKAGYTSARAINRGIDQHPRDRFRLRVVRVGVHDDVIHAATGTVDPALPTFTARMAGVSDKAPDGSRR